MIYKYFKSYNEAFNSLKVETAPKAIFTKAGNTFDPIYTAQLLEQSEECSLVGHLLDARSQYYEIHSQCFVLNINDWRASGSPKFVTEGEQICVNVNRSEENFHDHYTPKSLSKAEGKQTYKKIKNGGMIISALLEHGYKIRPWSEEERKHKFYLYNDLTMKYGSYIRIEGNINDTVFNVTNEPLMKTTLESVTRIVTPANGFQALTLLDKCPNVTTIDFKDISQGALDFTQKLIKNYKGHSFADFCYESGFNLHCSDRQTMDKAEADFLSNLSCGFDELLKRLEGVNCRFARESFFEVEQLINTMDGSTLYNFSNILSYRKTSYLYSQIHFNLMIKTLASAERIAGNDSYFMGMIPTSETEKYGHTLTSVKKFTLDPDPVFKYPWREDLYEYYTDYLGILRAKEARATSL
jgi:hypothetical protein